MPEFPEFVYWVFLSLLSGCAMLITRAAWMLNKSVNQLNVRVAVVIERIAGHEKRIKKLESKQK